MKDRVLSSLITGVPRTFDVAEGDARMCGVLVMVESSTGRALSIERVRFDAEAASAEPP
jgi:calcineurin-like phosphoesterase